MSPVRILEQPDCGAEAAFGAHGGAREAAIWCRWRKARGPKLLETNVRVFRQSSDAVRLKRAGGKHQAHSTIMVKCAAIAATRITSRR